MSLSCFICHCISTFTFFRLDIWCVCCQINGIVTPYICSWGITVFFHLYLQHLQYFTFKLDLFKVKYYVFKIKNTIQITIESLKSLHFSIITTLLLIISKLLWICGSQCSIPRNNSVFYLHAEGNIICLFVEQCNL